MDTVKGALRYANNNKLKLKSTICF